MEPIDLTFKSPGLHIKGLDESLQKLERLDTLLGLFGQRTLNIDVRVNGAGQIGATADSMREMIALMKAAGQVKPAENLGAGYVTMGESVDVLRKQLGALVKEQFATEQYLRSNMAKMAAMTTPQAMKFGDPGQAAAWRKGIAESEQLIGKQTSRVTELQATIGMLQRAVGIGQALEGLDIFSGAKDVGAAAAAADKFTAAEKKVEAAAVEATGAMNAQGEVAQRKAKLMADLAAAVDKTTAAEKKNTAAQKENVAAARPVVSAPEGGSLLKTRQRWVRNDAGEMELASDQATFRTGPGAAVTRDMLEGATETRTTDEIARFKERHKKRMAEFKQAMATATTETKAVLAGQLANELRQMHTGMATAGLGGTEFASSLLGQAGEMTARSKALGHAAVKQGLAGEAKMDKLLFKVRLQQEREAAREAKDAAKSASDMDKLFWKEMDAYNKRKAAAEEEDARETKRAAQRAAAADAERAEATRMAAERRRRAQVTRMAELEFAEFAGQHGAKVGRSQYAVGADGVTTVRQKAMHENRVTGKHETAELVSQFDASGNKLSSTLKTLNNDLSRTGRGVTSVGANFVRNVASVTTWTAAVGALYAALGALRAGFGGAVDIDRKLATLQAVFRGTEQGARSLAQATLGLAVANGRSGQEALEAAVKWGRLGMSQIEATEAVRVSLMAANVAEISVADSTEHLSAMFNNYRLSAGQLIDVLNAMNSISNTLNVTVGDLMEGISKVGPLAKQSGLGLTELMGMIGAAKSATGRPGGEFGNTIKSAIIAFNNPELQKSLRDRFNIDLFNPQGDLKSSSDIFGELFARTSGMSRGTKGEVLQKIGGKTQGSRLEAILDNYLVAQEKSVTAQLDLNSAQREGNLILETTASKVASVGAAWSKLWDQFYQSGGKKPVNQVLSGAAVLMEGVGNVVEAASNFATQENSEQFFLRWGAGLKAPDQDRRNQAAYRAKINERVNAAGREFSNVEGVREAALNAANTLVFGGLRRIDFLKEEEAGSIGRTAGIGLGMKPEGARGVGAELSALVRGGNRNALRARMEELYIQARKVAESQGIPELDAAKAVEDTIEGAKEFETRLIEKLEPLRGHIKSLEPEIATAKERLEELDKILQEFRRRRAQVPDISELPDVIPPAVTTFRESVEGRQAALELLGQRPVFGRRQADRIREERRRLDEQDALVAAMEREKQADTFSGLPLNDAARRGMQDEIDRVKNAAKARRRILDAQAGAGGTIDSMTLAGEDFTRRMGAFGSGLSPTAQMESTLRGAAILNETMVKMAAGAEKYGMQVALANTLLQTRDSLLERQFTIERDIANEKERQNREAGRALMFASREDQLRGALLQRHLQQNGRMDAGSFMFMSEADRNAARLVPGIMPRGADTLGDLQDERDQLRRELPRLLEMIQQMLRQNGQGGRDGQEGGQGGRDGRDGQVSATVDTSSGAGSSSRPRPGQDFAWVSREMRETWNPRSSDYWKLGDRWNAEGFQFNKMSPMLVDGAAMAGAGMGIPAMAGAGMLGGAMMGASMMLNAYDNPAAQEARIAAMSPFKEHDSVLYERWAISLDATDELEALGVRRTPEQNQKYKEAQAIRKKAYDAMKGTGRILDDEDAFTDYGRTLNSEGNTRFHLRDQRNNRPGELFSQSAALGVLPGAPGGMLMGALMGASIGVASEYAEDYRRKADAPPKVDLSMNFGEQANALAAIMQETVQARLDGEIADIRATMDTFIATVLGPGVAQNAGVEAVLAG